MKDKKILKDYKKLKWAYIMHRFEASIRPTHVQIWARGVVFIDLEYLWLVIVQKIHHINLNFFKFRVSVNE